MNRFHWLFLLPALLVLSGPPSVAWADDEPQISADSPAEFLLYQSPGAYYIVKTAARGAEFESRIFDADRSLLKVAAVPARRIGPVYQFVDSTNKPRQLRIDISPGRAIDRSDISMELIRFETADPNSGALLQAYRFLATGMEAAHAGDTTTWAMKVYTLRNAARAFAGLGMEEMRLWAEYYAAHLVLHGLGDELTAMEFARDIRSAARRAGRDEIRLAALLLEGEALFRLSRDAHAPEAAARLDRAHEVLAGAEALAAELGYPSERARALYSEARIYEMQTERTRALQLYDQAIGVALAAGDSELANEVRAQAALAFEAEGETGSAIAMLERISGDLEKQDSTVELAATLYEQGRLFNTAYRYPEAARELGRALELLQSTRAGLQWGPTGLALAHSHYAMGDMERAASLILESETRVPLPHYAPMLSESYGQLANIHRYQQRYETMRFYREKQLALAMDDSLRAAALLEQAVDVMHSLPPGSAQALQLLTRSRELAANDRASYRVFQAEMWLCFAVLERGTDHVCAAADLEAAYAGLLASAVPRLMLEADYLMAKIHLRRGDSRSALRGFERLVDDLGFFRARLPGVLGGWYWETREEIFSEYLSLVMTAARGQVMDGMRALLALERVRSIERLAEAPVGVAKAGNGGDLRTDLARLDPSGVSRSDIAAQQVRDGIAEQRRAYETSRSTLNAEDLRRLIAGFARDESLLTYHFSEDRIHALVASHKGVYLTRLSGSDRVRYLLRTRPRSVSANDLRVFDELGSLLVEPLNGLLKSRVYFVPAGRLNGFPLDLLRIRGEFLASGHEVTHLFSLAALKRRRPVLHLAENLRVFLAGNPRPKQELFSYEHTVSADIQTFAGRFAGPGLHIVQGVALRRDEFEDERFVEADLLHLAIPGIVDLARPDRSRFLLSGVDGASPNELLQGVELRHFNFDAKFAMLGGLSLEQESRSPFSSSLGLVSDFHAAGVPAVVASLWRLDAPVAAVFVADFYDTLASEPDLGTALWKARNRGMQRAEASSAQAWAPFQLFVH
ncbi:MAG: CHAT domain-containing protein [Xanthomonadales bacterium]|nr:CHAT domain-containing protein [Xanthomonadales bacterium]